MIMRRESNRARLAARRCEMDSNGRILAASQQERRDAETAEQRETRLQKIATSPPISLDLRPLTTCI